MAKKYNASLGSNENSLKLEYGEECTTLNMFKNH
jgi:hypothetical protein